MLGLGAAMIATGAGCSIEPSVANRPTYEADVQPILLSRCVRCHGDPPLQAAPVGFRFDVFACLPNDATPGNCTVGAGGSANLMVARLRLGNDISGHMPPKPAAPLSAYQVDTIAAWAAENPPLER